MFPDNAGWTNTDMLLAELVDTVHWLQWVKTKDGQRNQGMPPRVPRPGVTVARAGLKPKAAPLSVIKEKFDRPDDPDRAAALQSMFGR